MFKWLGFGSGLGLGGGICDIKPPFYCNGRLRPEFQDDYVPEFLIGTQLYRNQVMREQQESMDRMAEHARELDLESKQKAQTANKHTIDGECSVVDVKRLEDKHD